MLKIEKEYNDVYGSIPSSYDDRISILTEGFTKSKLDQLDEEVIRIKNIKKRSVKFILYITPKPTPRPRTGKGGVFYVKGASDNKKIFKKYYENIKNVGMIYTPCSFKCVSYLPIPSSMNKLEKVLAEMGLIKVISRPDWDNLAKTYCDMIQGTLIYDDALIYSGTMTKKYSIKPRIEVELEYYMDYDSKYNKQKMKRKEGC